MFPHLANLYHVVHKMSQYVSKVAWGISKGFVLLFAFLLFTHNTHTEECNIFTTKSKSTLFEALEYLYVYNFPTCAYCFIIPSKIGETEENPKFLCGPCQSSHQAKQPYMWQNSWVHFSVLVWTNRLFLILHFSTIPPLLEILSRFSFSQLSPHCVHFIFKPTLYSFVKRTIYPITC